MSVHAHHTGLYESVCLAAAAHSGIGQEAVQADGLVGIIVGLLVLNLLLHIVLGVRIVVGRARTARTTLSLSRGSGVSWPEASALTGAFITDIAGTGLIVSLTLTVAGTGLIASLALGL